ncbi:MAG: adenylosuccinate synthase [Helicobacter sp.]|nr:adenylosuccinate synthase [Helicobacter sp.]
MADLILGIQWGDEGKGKIVDYLASKYDFVVRYGGGHNAGHTIVTDKKYALHLLPSGVLHNCKNVIANGVVISLSALNRELCAFDKAAVFISSRAHVITPYHEALDKINEAKFAIGTTKKGIGPAYTDKVARSGIEIQDLFNESKLLKKLCANYEAMALLDKNLPKPEVICKELLNEFASIKHLVCDTTKLLWDAQDNGEKILLEGAQGSMLDINHGTYPYVTSSDTLASGASSGSGLASSSIKDIIGVFKAYCTRVGNGAFPSEESGPLGEKIAEIGHEFGTTTGRKRRIGWLDLVALKYAIRLNGCTSLAIMKMDVLDGFESIKICVGYEQSGEISTHMSSNLDEVKPIFKELKGWGKTAGLKSFDELPKEAKDYLKYIEDFVGVKIKIISTSPQRSDLIHRD